MNTGLGLNFLRIVNEEGASGWSQIYAKVPFDDTELRSKGALFGAVLGTEKAGWADVEVEMMSWVDEYFNGVDEGGDLAGFFREWRLKYPDLASVWVWIRLVQGGAREIKVVKWGEAGVFLKKNGTTIDLTRNVEEGRVLKGFVKEDQILYLWGGQLGEKLLQIEDVDSDEDKVVAINKEIVEENLATAGLILRIEKMVEESDAVATPSFAEPVEVHQSAEVAENISTETENVPVDAVRPIVQVNDLVGNRYVGPVGVKEKLANWWGSALKKDRREIRIDTNSTKRKKWAGILGVVFLFLLLISLITGSIKMKSDAEEKKWRSFYEPIERSRLEAVGLIELNPAGAKKMMEEVKMTFDVRKAEFVNGKHKAEVADLEQKILASWTVTSGEKSSNIEDLLKINLVRQGFVGDRLIAVPGGKLLAADMTLGVAVMAEVSTKDIRVVAGKVEGELWIDVVGEEKNTLVLTKTGVKSAEKAREVITFDSTVVEPVAVGRFGGNLYVLDKANKEVYKYGVSDGEFGSRSRWLKSETTMGLIPVDMAIDADIWVVSESGQVEKFRRGSKESFAISGLPAEAKISRLAVELDGPRIAMLDAGAGVIHVCSKDTGNCSQQLKSEHLKMARDVEFGEDGSVFVLYSGMVGSLK